MHRGIRPVSAPRSPAEAAQLLAEIRPQRHTGQSRIVTAPDARNALDPGSMPTTPTLHLLRGLTTLSGPTPARQLRALREPPIDTDATIAQPTG
jgi:hypothetical protein